MIGRLSGILLEKNPLRARNPLTMTIWRRTSLLHSPSTGDLFFRWCGAAIVSVLPNLALGGSLPWMNFLILLVAVLMAGVVVAGLATISVAQAPLIPALRKD